MRAPSRSRKRCSTGKSSGGTGKGSVIPRTRSARPGVCARASIGEQTCGGEKHSEPDDPGENEKEAIARLDIEPDDRAEEHDPDDERRRVEHLHAMAHDLADDDAEADHERAQEPRQHRRIAPRRAEQAQGELRRDEEPDPAEGKVADEIEEAQPRPAHHGPPSMIRATSCGFSRLEKWPQPRSDALRAPGIARKLASRSPGRDQSWSA